MFREQGDANAFCILTGDGRGWVLGLLHNGEPLPATQRANLEFIVRACNAHDGLVSTLAALLAHIEAGTDIDSHEWRHAVNDARAALAVQS